MNIFRNTLVQIQDKIPITSTHNCVCVCVCVDRDVLYIEESCGEIETRVKEHRNYPKRPPNNFRIRNSSTCSL